MLLILATIMTIIGSIFGPVYVISLHDSKEDIRFDKDVLYLWLALWLGGTLGGITTFWVVAW